MRVPVGVSVSRRIITVVKLTLASLLLVAATLTAVYRAPTASAYAGGSGTSGSPYQISDCTELQAARTNYTSYFVLINDIDCSDTINWNSGAGFLPIGTLSNRFSGNFNGQGYTISDVYINTTGQYTGLFGITNGGTITDFILDNPAVVGGTNSGTLAGYINTTTVSQVDVAGGTVAGTTNSSNIGGFAGQIYNATVSYNTSSAAVTITGTGTKAGGFAGLITNSANVNHSSATGAVSGTGEVGGFSGAIYTSASVSDSYAKGNVTSTGDTAAGFSSRASGGVILTRVGAEGTVTGTGKAEMGGLLGFVQQNVTVSQSYSRSDITGSARCGGIVAEYNDYGTLTVQNSYATGTINCATSTGGLVGFGVVSGMSFTNTYSAASIPTIASTNAGWCGQCGGMTVSNSFWDLNASGQSTGIRAYSPYSNSGAPTSKTTVQMQSAATFTDTSTPGLSAAWDFVGNPNNDMGNNDYWDINADFNQGYPYLVWQPGQDPVITGGSDVSGEQDEAVPITDLVVQAEGNPTVPVRLHVSYGTLTLGITTGLTVNGYSFGDTIEFSGSKDDVNAALASLTYTRSDVGTDTLEVSLAEPGEVYFEGTGHLYEYVSMNGDWNAASTDAQTRTKYGASGYLATITSDEENAFITGRLLDEGWMGASDISSEGAWQWVTGPEAGTTFSNGNAGSMTPVPGEYENWNDGEPNDAGGEDCGQMLTGGSGMWNDLPCGMSLPGYIVEYGDDSTPVSISSTSLTITTTEANVAPLPPWGLGGSGYVNGGWSSDTTPLLSFNMFDDNTGAQVSYRVQIDDSSDFSSPVVDYTSAFWPWGVLTFTVGQATNGGTYAVGAQGQVLASQTQYYWRVKAIDEGGLESAYTTARSGQIAFGIDVTAPSVPADVSVSRASGSARPELTWTASSDGTTAQGSGLAATPYTVRWSTDPTFSTGVSTGTSSTTSFIVPSDLAEETWYFQVSARDSLGNVSAYSAAQSILVDVTEPLLQSTTPATGTTDVALDADLTMTFDELAGAHSGDIKIYRASDDSLVETIPAGGGPIGGSGTATLTINPFNDFEYETEYYVLVDNGAIHDLNGNAFAGLSSPTDWTFRTVDAPPVPTTPSTNGGTAQGGSNVSVVTSDSSSQPDPTESTPQPTGGNGKIVLNDFEEYGTDGKQLPMSSGQVVYFLHQQEEHSATIQNIDPGYVTIVIASTPQTVVVYKGDPLRHDVDGDGTDDIEIAYAGMDEDGRAQLTFKQLAQAENQNDTVETVSSWNWWWLVIIGVLTLAIIGIIVSRRSTRRQ